MLLFFFPLDCSQTITWSLFCVLKHRKFSSKQSFYEKSMQSMLSSVCYQDAWLIYQHSLNRDNFDHNQSGHLGHSAFGLLFFFKGENINGKSIILKGSWICFDFLWVNFKLEWRMNDGTTILKYHGSFPAEMFYSPCHEKINTFNVNAWKSLIHLKG